MSEERVPLKLAAGELNTSRSSLWRASRSNIAGFPTPVKHRGRVYWLRADMPALAKAFAEFEGRGAFERERKHEKARVAREAAAAAPKQRRIKAKPSDARQPDLFGDKDAPAPRGAETPHKR